MTILEAVKGHMRISHSKLDNEIAASIDASMADLSLAGIDVSDADKKPLVVTAIKLYCDANVGYRADSEKYQNAYNGLKTTLSLAAVGDSHE